MIALDRLSLWSKLPLWAGFTLAAVWASTALAGASEQAAVSKQAAASKQAAVSKQAAASASPGLSAEQAARRVDALLARDVYAKQPKAELAPGIDDEAFLRRAALDVIGVRPNRAEMALFLLDPSANRRQKLVDRLLADPRFGRNWGRYWRDVVMYRRVEDRALLSAAALETFLTESLNAGRGWDFVARSLIEAKGSAFENGPTGLIMAQSAVAADVAAEVSRIFLGIQIQCAQCHDHPTDRWKREQFHEFAAFFPRMQLRPILVDGRQRGIDLISFDFEPRYRRPGMVGRASLEHYMPDLNNPTAKGKLMAPVFFATGRKLEAGSTDMQRRTAAADWITSREDAWFAKAFVNRMWAELVGEGFYEPVDDMGPGKSCSAPATLDHLAEQFAAHQYDVKWLVRTILASEVYARESRSRRNPGDMPFAANCRQRLRGDQLYDVLHNALGLEPPAGFGGYGLYAAFASPRRQFDVVFGFDPSQRRDEVAGSISQALAMMNSSLITRGLSGRGSQSSLGRLLTEHNSDEAVIEELFLRTLARDPTQSELAAGRKYVKQAADRAEAFEDLLWGLVNRTEFIYRN